MVKKTITYTDLDGIERSEVAYFNINKAEFIDLEMTTPGGFFQNIEALSKKKDVVAIYGVLKTLIAKSYGVKAPDGRKMMKNQEILDDFLQSEAYAQLLEELFSDPENAIRFIAGVLPVDDKDALDNAINEAIAAMPAEE